MKSKVRCSFLLFIIVFMFACQTRVPILFYKDTVENPPQRLPLRAGLVMESTQAFKGVRVSGGLSGFFPLIPIYFASFKAEFPKGKESEFMNDMIRSYFIDSGIFEYIYPYPFKSTDVDLTVNIKFTKFKLTNSKFLNYLNKSFFSLIPGVNLVALLILPQESYKAVYEFDVHLILPNGKVIKEYHAEGKGRKGVSLWKEPYGKYLFYNSIFKKKLFQLLDEVKQRIFAEREEIINAYKEYVVK